MNNKFSIIKNEKSIPELIISGGDKAVMRMIADAAANNERVEKILSGADEIIALFSLLDHDNIDWLLLDDGITIAINSNQFEKDCNGLPLQTLMERYGFKAKSVIL